MFERLRHMVTCFVGIDFETEKDKKTEKKKHNFKKIDNEGI
jgi:hypothetical protein